MVNTGQLIWAAMLFALILSVFGVIVGITTAALGWISGSVALILMGFAVFVISSIGFYGTYRWFTAAA